MVSILAIAEWMAFIGRQADLNQIGSPYLITFPSDISGSTAVKPLNATIYSCGDPSLGCSCGDCPSSSVCTGSLLPQLNTETSCSVKMGSLKVATILLLTSMNKCRSDLSLIYHPFYFFNSLQCCSITFASK